MGSMLRIRQMLVKHLMNSACSTKGTRIAGCMRQRTLGHGSARVSLSQCVCVCLCVQRKVMCRMGMGHPCESAIVCVIAYS